MVQKLPSSHQPPPAAEVMSVVLSPGWWATPVPHGMQEPGAPRLSQSRGKGCKNPPAAPGDVVRARSDPRPSSPPPAL